MHEYSDAQLLREYAEKGSESSFREIVDRHAGLVYSTALRQLDSADLARDVAQEVFSDLARKARVLKQIGNGSLVGWLYRSTRFAALGQLRNERRRLTREKEVMQSLDHDSEGTTDWDRLRLVLDDAMAELKDEDREAVLLRYFENHDFRKIGKALGVSDDAAQKRVSRALEKLHAEFARRGVTTTAIALAGALSAHAVTEAPAGLSVALSSSALTAAKAIAMTTIHKTIIGVALSAAIGAGFFEAHQNSVLQERVQALEKQNAPTFEQIRQLQRERDSATNQLVQANREIEQLKSGQLTAELLKLRSQVGILRQQLASAKNEAGNPGFFKMLSDPAMRDYIHTMQLSTIRARFGPLFKELKLTAEQTDNMIKTMGNLYMTNCDKMYSLPQGTLGSAEIAQGFADREAELNKQLLPLIGEAGCKRLREYQDEFPGGATVDLVNGQLGANQLSDEQSTRLREIVKSEPFDLTRGISGDWDPAFWGTQEDIENHLLKVAESNQRTIQQASGFLTPDQLSALSTILNNGINERISQAAALIQKH